MLDDSLKNECIRVVLVLGLVSGAGMLTGCGKSERERKENRQNCAKNLVQIGQSIQTYADTYAEDGEKPLPDNLNVLVEQTDLDEEALQCPEADGAEGIDYEYIGSGLAMKQVDTSATVIAFDKRTNHQGYINTLFGDGHVEGAPAENIDELLEDHEEWHMADAEPVDQKALIKKHYEQGKRGFLGLNSAAITDEGLKHLGDLEKLTELGLRNTHITDEGLKHLRGLDKLTNLSLRDADITDKGLKHLQHLDSLRLLNLSHTDITDEGLKHLQDLDKLKKLWLINTDITGEGLKYLQDIDKLNWLWLNNTDIADEGLEHLQNLNNLGGLNLGKNRITDDELKHLKGFDNLETLGLGETDITDKGLQHLQDLSKLRVLNLNGTDVTDEGLKYLEVLDTLRKLRLSNTDVTDEGLNKLKESLPDMEVKR